MPCRQQQVAQANGSVLGTKSSQGDSEPIVRPYTAAVAKLSPRVRHRATLDFCALAAIRNGVEIAP